MAATALLLGGQALTNACTADDSHPVNSRREFAACSLSNQDKPFVVSGGAATILTAIPGVGYPNKHQMAEGDDPESQDPLAAPYQRQVIDIVERHNGLNDSREAYRDASLTDAGRVLRLPSSCFDLGGVSAESLKG